MNSCQIGDGSIFYEWLSIEGQSGLQPRLALKGKLVARGYGIGSLLLVSAEVTAWDIAGTYAYLGTTTPKSYVLNWNKQPYVRENAPPADETTWDIETLLPFDSAILEGLEEKRQGKDFSLTIDTLLLLVDSGRPLASSDGTTPNPYPYPKHENQDRLQISQHVWGQVLERWERGFSIPILVPLPAVEPDPGRAEIVRHLKEARQKIDGADYSGSLAATRKALELLRTLSSAILPLPKDSPQRDVDQRIHAVIESLFSLASASAHVDGATKDFVPLRADAVAAVASTAAITQEVFARLADG
jgi:hypothetical protein